MTSAEKAVNAVNRRIETLQSSLRDAQSDTTRQRLFECVLVTVGLGEALTSYIKSVGAFAQRRHGELKETNASLTGRHADALKSGQDLLERLKKSPTDRTIRKEIELAQQNMAAIQKTLRRSTNALQRDVAPSLAMIDKLAASVRRFSEAEDRETLPRALKTFIEHARELYAAQQILPSNDPVDAQAWEKSALADIDQATDAHDAYARAGYQAIRAVEMMTMAVSETPPRTANEANNRANEAVAARIKEMANRFMTTGTGE
jgi:hypothetical protein